MAEWRDDGMTESCGVVTERMLSVQCCFGAARTFHRLLLAAPLATALWVAPSAAPLDSLLPHHYCKERSRHYAAHLQRWKGATESQLSLIYHVAMGYTAVPSDLPPEGPAAVSFICDLNPSRSIRPTLDMPGVYPVRSNERKGEEKGFNSWVVGGQKSIFKHVLWCNVRQRHVMGYSLDVIWYGSVVGCCVVYHHD